MRSLRVYVSVYGMSAILAMLSKVPIWAWLALVAIGVIGWQYVQISHYKAAAISAEAETVVVKAANVANVSTITSLTNANNDWAIKCAANEPQAISDGQQSMQFESITHAEVDEKIKAIHAEAEHDVSVKTWISTAVPLSVIRALRG